MRDSKHELVLSPVINDGPQLILDVFGLLSRKSWYREGSMIALPAYAMAGCAIVELRLKLSIGKTSGLGASYRG